MAQINKPSEYFNTVTWTGNGSTQSITGVNFQPDLNWSKKRTAGNEHALVDAVRGATKTIYSNLTNAEGTQLSGLTSFDSDGFSIGSSGEYNDSGQPYVGWNWLANGSGASNTDGSITSTVSASTTSGFSIVSYTGTGANATVGHGLGSAPKMVIVKRLSNISSWSVYNSTLGNSNQLYLNLDWASTSSTTWNNTSPTSSVFSLSSDNGVNASGNNFIAYCFAEKKGYSKFSSYTGNGSTDGTFIYTGFKPAFVLLKCSSTTGDWQLIDTKRSTFNVCNLRLQANLSDAEAGSDTIDILSNGFKQRNTFGNFNSSGATYIYMAFAEEPLVGTNNVPATAR